MAQPSSGTYLYQPAFSDLLLESYSRIQVRPTSLTADHMFQARSSANLLLSEWATKPNWPNLWEIKLFSVPLIQGQAQYSVPTNVVGILDWFIRTYNMSAATNLTNAFSTTATSTSVGVRWPNHGLQPGNQFAVLIPVSIGGILLQNFYTVATVPDGNNFTITAASAAVSTVPLGGVVPQFVTTVGSPTVTVNLPNHGLYAGNNFTVQVSTQVGGLFLSGVYQVVAVNSANQFTFTAIGNAAAGASAYENSGAAQVEGQVPGSSPYDRVLFPISRTEYADQPNKTNQAFPTTVWWDRQINSIINLWPTPDDNGPYTLYYYAMSQIQDVVLPQGATLDLPYRFLEAFAAGLAAKLARKYPPPQTSGVTVTDLKLEAQEAWDGASHQYSEDAPMYIIPGLSYLRN